MATGDDASVALTPQQVISIQPVGVTATAGENRTLTVSAFGSTPLSYQWRQDLVDLPWGTNASLTLVNLQAGNAGDYNVLISNAGGSLTSAVAVVTVNASAPVILTNLSNQSVLAGSNATLRVAAVGSEPLFYQWSFNNGILSGATNAGITLANVAESNEGNYRVTISNQYGTNDSATATLTVNHPPALTNLPPNLTLPAGTNWILRVLADGNQPLYYQWRFAGTNIAGATNASLVLSNIQAAAAGQYFLVVSNVFVVITNVVTTLTVVDSPPVIFEQPVSQSFLPGNAVVLRVLAYGTAPLVSQWWHDGAPIPGATNTVLTLLNLQSNDAGAYLITLTNAFGATNSSIATLSPGDPFPGQVDSPSIGFTQVTTNVFSSPVGIAHANDGSGRLFVVQQGGRIRVIAGTNVLEPPFLDLSSRVLTGIERGLLGLAFAPGFATNGHCYVNYTRAPDGATVISRFLLTTNLNLADTNSEQIIKVIAQPFANHNGGQIAFGPDGNLYIGMGDGGYAGSTGDPFTNAQNPASLLGKLLRLDVEGGVAPYAVPTNNPFVANTNYAPEIWALGLRNPWRFSFDRASGDLYIGDVGHLRYEEIDFQPAASPGGENYGWRVREAAFSYNQPAGFDLSTLTSPVTWYDHTLGAAVTGGYIYRGPYEPRMNGNYVFGDYISGRIWQLNRAGTNWQRTEITDTVFGISTFGEDEQGRLYLADHYGGRIYRINDLRITATPTVSPAGGSFANDQNVVVNCATPGVTIHCTTDGREPSEFDPALAPGGALGIGASTTLRVRAFRRDLAPGGIRTANYSFQAAAPVFTPGSPITNGTPITVSSTTTGAVYYYTLDGSDPGPNSPVYTGPLMLNGNTTLRVKARKGGYQGRRI